MFSRRVGRTLAYISTGTREAVRLDRQTNSHRPGRDFIDVDHLLTTAQLAGQGVLVAGGTGGLGYRLGLWLLRQGAARVLLTGRSGRLAEQEDPAGALPASLEIHRLDICDEDAVAAFLAEQRDHPVPIRGVFQAAMVLRDQTLRQLDRETFRAVLAPKVRGAEILDRLTREMDLRCFVLFSSVASALGNAGQAAYVVANRAMENLARRRAEPVARHSRCQLPAVDTATLNRSAASRWLKPPSIASTTRCRRSIPYAQPMKTSLAKNTRAGNQTSVKKDSTFVKCALVRPACHSSSMSSGRRMRCRAITPTGATA